MQRSTHHTAGVERASTTDMLIGIGQPAGSNGKAAAAVSGVEVSGRL